MASIGLIAAGFVAGLILGPVLAFIILKPSPKGAEPWPEGIEQRFGSHHAPK